ncbi:hypothetical protein OAA09_01415 [bacterium]|nr:hypothetical protein [bacterium]
MKPGDLVKNISARDKWGKIVGEIGLFMGLNNSAGYEYAEVMWFTKSAPNGDRVSSIQKSLIVVVK